MRVTGDRFLPGLCPNHPVITSAALVARRKHARSAKDRAAM
jgi:hypothetical protein